MDDWPDNNDRNDDMTDREDSVRRSKDIRSLLTQLHNVRITWLGQCRLTPDQSQHHHHGSGGMINEENG